MKNYTPIGLIVLIFAFTLSIFIFFCESQAENLTPIYLLLLGSESVSDTIGPAGGYLEIQDAKDNLYRLIIPQGALTKQKLITIKPLTAAGGFASQLGPLSGGLALFPQGLTFSTPANLEIVLSKNTSIPPVPAIYLEEETGKPGILLQVVKLGQKLTTSLEHFSTATPVGPSALELQLFIDIAEQQISQWEANCAATIQMVEKRNFYKDSWALEAFILRIIQIWGLGGDFDYEQRIHSGDFCGGLFDNEVTYINICYAGTCWPPGMGNVKMEANEQRQFDYEIVCVNGFCQGDILWVIPRNPPDEPPIASVTQDGVVTALREGTGDLHAFSKAFSNIYVPDAILGSMSLDVRGDNNCVYIEEHELNGTHRYIRGCRDPDDYNKYTTIYHIFHKTYDIIQYVDEGVSDTIWINLDISASCKCAVTSGWSLLRDYDLVTLRYTHIFDYGSGACPYRYNGPENSGLCWPEMDGDVCGPYVCPLPGSVVTHNAFPGDCHTWWNHIDESGMHKECTYP